jgi:hypothetical protein
VNYVYEFILYLFCAYVCPFMPICAHLCSHALICAHTDLSSFMPSSSRCLCNTLPIRNGRLHSIKRISNVIYLTILIVFLFIFCQFLKNISLLIIFMIMCREIVFIMCVCFFFGRINDNLIFHKFYLPRDQTSDATIITHKPCVPSTG